MQNTERRSAPLSACRQILRTAGSPRCWCRRRYERRSGTPENAATTSIDVGDDFHKCRTLRSAEQTICRRLWAVHVRSDVRGACADQQVLSRGQTDVVRRQVSGAAPTHAPVTLRHALQLKHAIDVAARVRSART
jgi:hypothetical protein